MTTDRLGDKKAVKKAEMGGDLVYGSRCMVQGVWFKVHGSRSMVQGSRPYVCQIKKL